MNRGGFSWKRFLGVSAAKAKLSRSIGIPLTKGGRQRKLGRLLTGGCLISFIAFVVVVWALVVASYEIQA